MSAKQLDSVTRLDDGRVAVRLLLLVSGLRSCNTVEVFAVGSDVTAVVTMLRRHGFRVSRPRQRHGDIDVETLQAFELAGDDFIWRDWEPGGGAWMPSSKLLA
jgi:hypothetical protein